MIDRYKILEQLGEGGSGSVFKAWDTKLQRHVAVKSLLPPDQREAAAGSNLAAEAAALSALQHPNIVAVYDLDTDGPEPFVVMEFINGETLESTVRRGALLPEDFQKIAAETLEGLIAAHKLGMCHRDLKPSNLMFHWLPDGKWQTKLLDFGLANHGLRPAQQEFAGEGRVAGSVHFMAPEQFLHQPLDVRTDLYSLGCVLYYSLTGSFPCTGSSVDEVMNAHLSRQVTPLKLLRPDLPQSHTDWVMWLMSRQPEERPESAAEALRVFRGILSGEISSIPNARALKTKEIRSTGPVVAAPLSRNTAARSTAVRVPTVSQPLPARVTMPAAMPARRRKSKAPRLAGLAALLVAGGTAAFFLLNKKNDPAQAGGGPSGAQSPVGAGLPDKNLVIWFDASRGARKDSGSTAAAVGDRIDQWDDSARLAGNNPAQYHTTGAGLADKAQRRPTLMRISDSAGLTGTHEIMAFNGENNLIFARDKDKVGDPVKKEISGSKLTWIVVFSATGGEKQALLSAAVGKELRAWDTFVEGGKIKSGVRKAGGGDNHAELPFNPSAGYHIAVTVWDGASDRLRLYLTTPDGKTATSPSVGGTTDFGDVEKIRIGAFNPAPRGQLNYLKGGIATLAVYNTALSDAEREAATDYLCRRYFGRPAAK